MHLNFQISPLSNFLFFIKKADQHSLTKIRLLEEYLSNDTIELSFLGKREGVIWKQIEKAIGSEGLKQFKKAVRLIQPTFISYWNRASQNLSLWKQYFQSNQLLFQQIISDIQKLSGVEMFDISQIPIYLIAYPAKSKELNAWFAWAPKESFIVLEIPDDAKIPKNLFPLGILAHEFFHLILRKNRRLFQMINAIAKQNEKLISKASKETPPRIFLEELLVSSFIPEGYLREKYLNLKVLHPQKKPKDLLSWRQFVAIKLYDIAKNYVENQRLLNYNYLKKLVETLQF